MAAPPVDEGTSDDENQEPCICTSDESELPDEDGSNMPYMSTEYDPPGGLIPPEAGKSEKDGKPKKTVDIGGNYKAKLVLYGNFDAAEEKKVIKAVFDAAVRIEKAYTLLMTQWDKVSKFKEFETISVYGTKIKIESQAFKILDANREKFIKYLKTILDGLKNGGSTIDIIRTYEVFIQKATSCILILGGNLGYAWTEISRSETPIGRDRQTT